MIPAKSIRCVAGVLVGGRSTRMGRPKATLPLPRGKTMVEHVVEAALQAGDWIDEVVILGSCGPLPSSLAGLRSIPDSEAAAGPLSGLCSLLGYAGDRWGLLLACDMPLLHPSLLEPLRTAALSDCDAAAFRRGDRPDTWHACCAMYHPRVLPLAVKELREGRRSLQNLLAGLRVNTLDPSLEEQEMLVNLNTPEDYNRLLAPQTGGPPECV